MSKMTMPEQPKSTLEEKLIHILEVARFAPSVHNTQPWKVQLNTSSSLLISLDTDHTLHDSDPTGRQTIISLGIFCEALILAAANFGFIVQQLTFNDTSVLLYPRPGAPTGTKMVSLLKKRVSDRSVFAKTSLSRATIRNIELAGVGNKVTARMTTDETIIQKTAELTSKGIRVALTSPKFRSELSQYLLLPWSKQKRGIPVKSLRIPFLVGLIQPLLLRLNLGLRKEADLEKKRWLSASGIVFILGDGDMPAFWFEAGRAYLRSCLAIEAANLSQATSAAIVEASNYHEDIETMLGTQKRILAMVRIGSGSQKRIRSPRINAQTILTSS